MSINKDNVFWLGGSSCSGKSTCARIIAEKHNFKLYRTDDHAFGEYMFQISDEKRYPAIFKYRNMILEGMDSFANRDINDTFNAFMSYCMEVFPLLLADIVSLAKDGIVIVEGAHILPQLISEYYLRNNCMFLVSTKEQQSKLWRKEMNAEIPGGHPGEIDNYQKAKDKAGIERTRVEFHNMIAKNIIENSKKIKANYIILDNDRSIDEIVNVTNDLFHLN